MISEKSELNDKCVLIMEYRQQYESNSKPISMSSSKCKSIDLHSLQRLWLQRWSSTVYKTLVLKKLT
jgi:hypothetical protein